MQIHKPAGAGLESALNDLALLRIEVFRDFPYLYDGPKDIDRAQESEHPMQFWQRELA